MLMISLCAAVVDQALSLPEGKASGPYMHEKYVHPEVGAGQRPHPQPSSWGTLLRALCRTIPVGRFAVRLRVWLGNALCRWVERV